MKFLDCTTVLKQDFISGIQRILVDFATNNEEIAPVVWNTRKKRFERLSRFPRRILIYKSPVRRFFILVFLTPIFKISKIAFLRFKHQLLKFRTIRSLATRLYYAIHVKEGFESWNKLLVRKELIFSESDTLILLDIPTDIGYRYELMNELKNGNYLKVAYVHDLIPLDFPEFWGNREYPKIRKNFMDYLNCVVEFDLLVANSEYTLNRFESHFQKKSRQLNKIPLIIDVLNPSSNLITKRQNYPVEKHFDEISITSILFIGDLGKRKNLSVILKSILRDFEYPISLNIVSPTKIHLNSELKRLLNKVHQNDLIKIQIHDHISDDDLAELYYKSEILVVPSLAEGFGIPVIEGLSFGCQVVVSDNTSLSELAIKYDLIKVRGNSVSGWTKGIKKAIDQRGKAVATTFDARDFKPETFQKSLIHIIEKNRLVRGN